MPGTSMASPILGKWFTAFISTCRWGSVCKKVDSRSTDTKKCTCLGEMMSEGVLMLSVLVWIIQSYIYIYISVWAAWKDATHNINHINSIQPFFGSRFSCSQLPSQPQHLSHLHSFPQFTDSQLVSYIQKPSCIEEMCQGTCSFAGGKPRGFWWQGSNKA